MIKSKSGERGQALVIIAFGAIALIGITGLAIDGGSAYSDRRHAQNAADTSALAAALTSIRNPGNWPVARDAGFARASENGYNNNGTTNTVTVFPCNDVHATCELAPGDQPDQYVQVIIHSTIPTYLGRVVGMPTITNVVQAIARVSPPVPTPWYGGSALKTLMRGCKTDEIPNWPHDPLTIAGNSYLDITGAGGVSVDSSCNGAYTVQGGGTLSSVTGVCVYGTSVVGGTSNPSPTDGCDQRTATDEYQVPAVSLNSCSLLPVDPPIVELGGVLWAQPGTYNNSFPKNYHAAGTLKLQRGIYCIKGGMDLGAGAWNMTSDVDGNGTFDGSDGMDEGVLFYVYSGDVRFNGGSFVEIGAMNNPATDPGIKGYLFYVPATNPATITLNGGGGSTFIGTILAPTSHVTLSGSADSMTPVNYETQIISFTADTSGGGYIHLEYNQGQNATTYTNPGLILYK